MWIGNIYTQNPLVDILYGCILFSLFFLKDNFIYALNPTPATSGTSSIDISLLYIFNLLLFIGSFLLQNKRTLCLSYTSLQSPYSVIFMTRFFERLACACSLFCLIMILETDVSLSVAFCVYFHNIFISVHLHCHYLSMGSHLSFSTEAAISYMFHHVTFMVNILHCLKDKIHSHEGSLQAFLFLSLASLPDICHMYNVKLFQFSKMTMFSCFCDFVDLVPCLSSPVSLPFHPLRLGSNTSFSKKPSLKNFNLPVFPPRLLYIPELQHFSVLYFQNITQFLAYGNNQ